MSNEKINTVAEEEVLENVEFTEHAQDTVTGNTPKVEEVKENIWKIELEDVIVDNSRVIYIEKA